MEKETLAGEMAYRMIRIFMEANDVTGSVFFHLAFPVHDLKAAKRFYMDGLGCVLGRESTRP